MPAHLRAIVTLCQRCGKRATQRLFSTYNAEIGDFCYPCGRKALREYQEQFESEQSEGT